MVLSNKGSGGHLKVSAGVSTQKQSSGLVVNENSTFRNVALAVSGPFMALIDSFHIVTSLSNRSSIEKSIKSFLQMKGQIAY